MRQVSPEELATWMVSPQPPTLIDIREDQDWQAGHAAAALHVPRWTLSSRIGAIVPDKSARIVLYCVGGLRSIGAAHAIQRIGYTNVYSLSGGFKKYQLTGLPVLK